MNNLYRQLNLQSLSNSGNIQQLISAFKHSANPQQFISNLAKNNKNFSSLVSSMQNSNQTPKDLFYQLARQKGIDPDQIIKMIRQA